MAATEPKAKKHKKEKHENRVEHQKAKDIYALCKREDGVISFCQDKGLISSKVKCSCGATLQLKAQSDKYFWRCKKNGHKISFLVNIGTCFEHTQMPLYDALWVTYMWIYDYSLDSMLHEVDQPIADIVKWCQFCREVCVMMVERYSKQIGGPEVDVELEEIECSTVKHGKRRVIWGVTEKKSKAFIFTVPGDKSENKLVNLIEKYILPGTTICSRRWTAYSILSKNEFKHLTKELNIKFKDIKTSSIIKNFDVMNKLTQRERPDIEEHKMSVHYLAEYVYKKSFQPRQDKFLLFLQDMGSVFSPVTQIK